MGSNGATQSRSESLTGENWKKSSGPPHSASVLTVRCSGAQIVGFIELPFALGEPGCTTPFGPQIGAVGPKVMGPAVRMCR